MAPQRVGAHPACGATFGAQGAHQAANQLLRALLITAPEELKAELRGLSTAKLLATAARLRPGNPKDLCGSQPSWR
jgi:hypothetical protein